MRRRSIYTVLSAAAVLFFVGYLLKTQSQSHSFDRLDGSGNSASKSLSSSDCNLLFDCYTHGTWHLKTGLTGEMVTQRRELNKLLLKNLGFPEVLYRGDNRCGYGYLLPLSNVAALCDETSDKPCCNEATGTCGNAPQDCACPQCKDFRKYIDAELAQWRTFRNECPLENFRGRETCKMLNTHVTDLVFVGDSFVRHFFNAFALLITNDPLRGALKRTLSPEEREQCKGEMQFIDRGTYSCHLKTTKQWEEFDQTQVCEGNAAFRTHLVEAYGMTHHHLAMEEVKSLLGKRGAVVVLGVGMHFRLNSTSVIQEYLTPIIALVQNNGNNWPLIIWINIHQIDNFLTSDSQLHYPPIERFNMEMLRFCRDNNIPAFETSRITRGIKSHDGLHFGYGGNLAKVQILLNYLKTRFESCIDAVETP